MTENFEYWVAAYLMVPLIVVIFGRVFCWAKHDSVPEFFGGESKLFAIGSMLIVFFLWPLLPLGFLLEPIFTALGDRIASRQRVFCCKAHHLLEKVSVTDAEAAAKVIDPLHRVPDRPFGHLNPAWQAFLKKRRFGYSLRKFVIPGDENSHARDSECSTPRGQMKGYTWVMWRFTKAEIIFEWNTTV